MRQLTVKYSGECRRCGGALPTGTEAMYEKSMGIFCVGHEPIEVEDIRHFRQLKADIKADKYEAWAQKRREQAEATLEHNYEHYGSDIAFNTQPGHIPLRARVIAQDDRAYESLQLAKRMEEKAKCLRSVSVKGDAERRRQEKGAHKT